MDKNEEYTNKPFICFLNLNDNKKSNNNQYHIKFDPRIIQIENLFLLKTIFKKDIKKLKNQFEFIDIKS